MPIDAAYMTSYYHSIFNRFWDITPSLYIYTQSLFQVEMEKDGWEYVDMFGVRLPKIYWTIQP